LRLFPGEIIYITLEMLAFGGGGYGKHNIRGISGNPYQFRLHGKAKRPYPRTGFRYNFKLKGAAGLDIRCGCTFYTTSCHGKVFEEVFAVHHTGYPDMGKSIVTGIFPFFKHGYISLLVLEPVPEFDTLKQPHYYNNMIIGFLVKL
jgi:hypothetical protein